MKKFEIFCIGVGLLAVGNMLTYEPEPELDSWELLAPELRKIFNSYNPEIVDKFLHVSPEQPIKYHDNNSCNVRIDYNPNPNTDGDYSTGTLTFDASTVSEVKRLTQFMDPTLTIIGGGINLTQKWHRSGETKQTTKHLSNIKLVYGSGRYGGEGAANEAVDVLQALKRVCQPG